MNHREYFDRLASEWDELLEEETIARLREIVSGLEIRPGARVLDVDGWLSATPPAARR